MINVFGSGTGGEEIESLTPSVMTGWMGMGARVREFEARFAERLGQSFLMVDSGSNALYMAMTLLNLPPGSPVILPAMTWVACAQAVLLAGHKPVFADVNLQTQNIDAASIERVITRDTKAIMVVHYAGKPVRMETLTQFGLPILEDSAHAVDSMLGGRRCGTLGDLAIYSFDSVKNLATPEGGGVTMKNPALLERAKLLRYCGVGKSGFDSLGGKERWWEYDVREIFPKMLCNDICASIALAQLGKLPANQARRKQIWATYQRELADVPWITHPQDAAADEVHSYWTYLIRVMDGRRDALANTLLERKIYTTFNYHPLHLKPIYGPPARKLPNCELLSEQGLNLPLHPRLSDDDVAQVIDAVKTFGRTR
ncbi:MAG: DegT/DnrJ/EryC1/StrS family aminotransferase [Tepidisphaeraceae bacterium]